MLNDFLEVGIIPKGKSVKQKLVCPKCSPTRKNKHDKSLSIDLLKGYIIATTVAGKAMSKSRKRKISQFQ